MSAKTMFSAKKLCFNKSGHQENLQPTLQWHLPGLRQSINQFQGHVIQGLAIAFHMLKHPTTRAELHMLFWVNPSFHIFTVDIGEHY